MDQFSRFLTPTQPKGYNEFYDERKQLMGKELSVANLEKEDIECYEKMINVAQEMLIYGQDLMARTIMISMVSGLKLSMSLEGMFIENLLANKIEYAQTQTVHEYQHAPEKRGIFGGKKTQPGGP